MSYPTGSIPLTGGIGTTGCTDTFPTHYDFLGFGGARSIDTVADMYAITTQRRQWGMSVTVYADPTSSLNRTYVLSNAINGGVDNDITNNLNWKSYGSSPFLSVLSSVGLCMPSAFCVNGSPLTSNGSICVTGAGNASQYVRGDGTLSTFPQTGGAGGSLQLYMNGSTSEGTIGGQSFYQLSQNASTGAATNFTIATNGLFANFITDTGQPNQTTIPAGNWTFELFLSSGVVSATPGVYAEVYKYDGTTLTLLATSKTVTISSGLTTQIYNFVAALPQTTLASTDRIALKIYATNNGGANTVTLYTQGSNLSSVNTTFAAGIAVLNGLTVSTQYFATGNAGTDFNICSATATHTFNIPSASCTTRGLLTCQDYCKFSNSAIIVLDSGTGSSVRCGNSNCASGNYSSVTGGCNNTSAGLFGVVMGGFCNTLNSSSSNSAIVAGNCNVLGSTTTNSAIISGYNNQLCTAQYSFIGTGNTNCLCGGNYNYIGSGYHNCITSSAYSTISGGYKNTVTGNFSVITGGRSNTVSNLYGFIGGGCGNNLGSTCNANAAIVTGFNNCITSGSSSFIGGGGNNFINGVCGVIIGGLSNCICNSSCYGSISGGCGNLIYGCANSTIGGGRANVICNTYATISGGSNNIVTSSSGTIGGGYNNAATSGFVSTVSGGYKNTASGTYAFVGGGGSNIASGCSTAILGGLNNVASGLYSGAFGCNLNACAPCTWYTNNSCACGSFYSSALTNGCAVGVGANGQLVNIAPATAGIIVLGNCTGSSVRCGLGNVACGTNATVLGCANTTYLDRSAILSGSSNIIGSATPCGQNSFIVGGYANCLGVGGALIDTTVLGGGYCNVIVAASGSVLGGGANNVINGNENVIAGGVNNINCGYASSIGGGGSNVISSACFGFIGNGCSNAVSANYSFIGGGNCNTTSGTNSFVGGGSSNTASGGYVAIVGGSSNLATNTWSFVGGGQSNGSCGVASVLVGGWNNLSTGARSALVGGAYNRVQADHGFIGGGICNNACNATSGCLALGAVVVGGIGNNTYGGTFSMATCTFTVAPTVCNAGTYSFIGGGFQNQNFGSGAAIVGGYYNVSPGANSFIGGGASNAANSNYSAILGGCGNIASGAFSGAYGCNLTACSPCTFYSNNFCSCNLIQAATKLIVNQNVDNGANAQVYGTTSLNNCLTYSIYTNNLTAASALCICNGGGGGMVQIGSTGFLGEIIIDTPTPIALFSCCQCPAITSGIWSDMYKMNCGNVTGCAGLNSFTARTLFGGSGTVEWASGYYAQTPQNAVIGCNYAGCITNYAGMFIQSAKGGIIGSKICNAYGIYQEGVNDANYLAGSITTCSLTTGPVYSCNGKLTNCSGGGGSTLCVYYCTVCVGDIPPTGGCCYSFPVCNPNSCPYYVWTQVRANANICSVNNTATVAWFKCSACCMAINVQEWAGGSVQNISVDFKIEITS